MQVTNIIVPQTYQVRQMVREPAILSSTQILSPQRPVKLVSSFSPSPAAPIRYQQTTTTSTSFIVIPRTRRNY
jgi:hypothetical protein